MSVQRLNIQSSVYKRKGIDFLTGVMSEQGPDGWIWDRTIIQNKFNFATIHDKEVGSFAYNLTEGVSIYDWNNFAYSNFVLKYIDLIKQNNLTVWQPIYSSGEYHFYGKKMNLYSSYSVTERATFSANKFSLQLNEYCKADSITVGVYKRNVQNIRYLYREWKNDSAVRFNYTINEGLLEVAEDTHIDLRRSFTDGTDLVLVGENKGTSNLNGRKIFSEYFPIDRGTLLIYAVKGSSVVTYTDYTDGKIPANDYGFYCDYDLGIITTSGKSFPYLYLKEDMAADALEMSVGPVSSVIQYPDQGEVTINGETITYQNRSNSRLYNCVRSSAVVHAADSKVEMEQDGLGLGEDYTFYIMYRAAPRVEYEVTSSSMRKAQNKLALDLHPFKNLNNNGIIQLSLMDINVSSLVLEIDAPNILNNVFGPGYFGIDSKQLTATAYDSLGNTVEGVEVSIHIAQGNPGYLNSNVKTYVDITNSEGEIYASYNCPYDWDEISKEVLSVTHSNGNTILDIELIDDAYSLNVENVSIYEILKHDPVFGYVGNEFEVFDFGNDITIGNTFYLKSWFKIYNEDFNFVDSFSGSKCYIEYTDGGQSIATILEIAQTKELGQEKEALIILNKKLTPIQNGKTIAKVRLFARKTVQEPNQPNSLEWNSYLKIGCLKLLYGWNQSVTHPITKELGAYYPVRPTRFLSNTQMEVPGEIKIPDAFDNDNLLGGYRIVSSSVVEFYATCKNPLTNRTIVSNTVKLRLDLPKYLNGVSFDEGLPVPYGFGFVSNSLEVGTGLGGQNFISINPLQENILTLNIK